MSRDYFAHKAASFDQNTARVDNVAAIAEALLATIRLDRSMHLMDFGSGTGLLLERVAPHVGKITAVDVSESMNRQLAEKIPRLGCPVDIRPVDLVQEAIDGPFDGIISSMTLHHVADIGAIFRRFRAMLKDGGFIALADLDAEDGSFHSEDTGVFHNGFDRAEISRIAEAAGFGEVAVVSASVVRKPQRDYPVFLLTGRC
jgi:cyclopropane fatty-acyl-phospholipid synthase-like methyltransferase